jgi:hypothetical protein
MVSRSYPNVHVVNPSDQPVNVQNISATDDLTANKFVFEFLKLNGTGSIEMDVDGTTPQNFEYIVPTGFTFYLGRINFNIIDGAQAPTKFGGLGAVGTGLTNGLLFQVLNPGLVVQEHFGTDINPIKFNYDFAALAGVDSIVFAAAGDDHFPVRWTIARASSGIPMCLPAGYRFRLIVRDDLQAITRFYAMAQGYLIED